LNVVKRVSPVSIEYYGSCKLWCWETDFRM